MEYAEARKSELSLLRDRLRKDWHERSLAQEQMRIAFEVCYGSLTTEDIAFIRETEPVTEE